MSEGFSNPAPPSEGVDFATLLGSLLVVEVLGVEAHVQTIHTKPGEQSPAVRANIIVLDGEHADEDYSDTLIFPKVLQSQLRGSIGDKVLGRLGQGEKKPGKNPPWRLSDPTESDMAAATAWQARQRPAFASPQAAQSAAPPF